MIREAIDIIAIVGAASAAVLVFALVAVLVLLVADAPSNRNLQAKSNYESEQED